MPLNTSGLTPLDTTGLQPMDAAPMFDTSKLQSLDVSGLEPVAEPGFLDNAKGLAATGITALRRGMLSTGQMLDASQAMGYGESERSARDLETTTDPTKLRQAAWQKEFGRPSAEYGEKKRAALQSLVKREAEIAKIPAPKVVQEVVNAESFFDAWQAFKKAPATVITSVGLESAPISVGVGLSTAAGGATAGVPGAMSATGAASFAADFTSTVIQALHEEGVDFTDAAAVEKALADDDLMNRVEKRAYRHGLAVGLFDAATAGVASKVLAPARLANRPVARELTNFVPQMGAQAAGGAAGEAAGQVASGQDLREGEILTEALGELVTAPVDVAAAVTARGESKPSSFEEILGNPPPAAAGGLPTPEGLIPVTDVPPPPPAPPVAQPEAAYEQLYAPLTPVEEAKAAEQGLADVARKDPAVARVLMDSPPSAVSTAVQELAAKEGGKKSPLGKGLSEITAGQTGGQAAVDRVAGSETVTFKTAKGSTYAVQADGTTIRNKALRNDPGHEGDQGQKPRTDKTFYIPSDEAARLAAPDSATWRVIDHGDGTLSLATRNPDGKWGVSPDAKNVPVTTEPAVGLTPIELWGKEQVYGRDAYKTVHFGNDIVEVNRPKSRAIPVGELVKITTPDSSAEIEARPVLVELDSLKAATGKLQPRDRARVEMVQEAKERAVRLDPARLMPDRVSDAGAPIVSPDGTVISGNGRMLSIAEVYSNPALKAQANAYKAALPAEAQGMKKPVLVMQSQLSGLDAERFAQQSNRPRIATMSATEQANTDASVMGDILDLYQGGDFESSVNAPFLKAFATNVVASSERNSFSKDGQLSAEGMRRMQGAILARAYGESDLLSRMLESTDDNVRAIVGALQDAAPQMAALRKAVQAGQIMEGLDPLADISDAVKLISDMRKKRLSPAKFFRQMDAFTEINPDVAGWVLSLYNPADPKTNTDAGEHALSRSQMAAVFRAFANEAMQHKTGGFFDDETTRADILSAVGRNAAQGAALAEAPGASPSDGSGGTGAGQAPAGGRGSQAALGDAQTAAPARTQQGKVVASPEIASRLDAARAYQDGRAYQVDKAIVYAVHDELRDSLQLVPQNIGVGVLSSIQPIKGTRDVHATFLMATGKSARLRLPAKDAMNVRALHEPNTGSILFFRFNIDGVSGKGLRGEIRHELLHVLRSEGMIPLKLWRLLVSHARQRLRILESEQRTFLQAIGDSAWKTTEPGPTLEEKYREHYAATGKDTDEIEESLDQEAVAHFLELVYHKQTLPGEMVPEFQSFIDQMELGMFGRGEKPRALKGAMASLAGTLARTADAPALAKAKAMMESGASPEQTWQSTGWYKAADGWRFEIDDSGIDFKPNALRTEQRRLFPGDEKVERRFSGRLDELLAGADKLFAAYPQLRGLKVNIGFGTSLTGAGSIDPTTRAVTVESSNDLSDMLDTLIHEIQHAIQLEEGFDSGGNSSTLVHRTEVALFELTQQIAALQPGSNIRAELEAMQRQLKQQTEKFGGSISGFATSHEGVQAYRRLLGEVEARNSARRRKMTDAERKASFPRSTEDIPADEQYKASDLVNLTYKNDAAINKAIAEAYKTLPQAAMRNPAFGSGFNGISLSPSYSGENNPKPIANRYGNVHGQLEFSAEDIATAVKRYGLTALVEHLSDHVSYRRLGPLFKDEKTGKLRSYADAAEQERMRAAPKSPTELVHDMLVGVAKKHPEFAKPQGYVVDKADPEALIDAYQGKSYSNDDVYRLRHDVEKAIMALDGAVVEAPAWLKEDEDVDFITLTSDELSGVVYDFDAQGIGLGPHSIDVTFPHIFAELVSRHKKLVDEYRLAYGYVNYKSQKDNLSLSASMNVLGPRRGGTNAALTGGSSPPSLDPDDAGRLRKARDSALEFLQDAQVRVRRLVERSSEPLPDDADPYMAMTLYHGRLGGRAEEAVGKAEEILRGANAIAKATNSPLENVKRLIDLYLVAKHAPERNAVHGDGSAGITNAEATTALARIAGHPQGPEIIRVAGLVQAMNRRTLQTLLDGKVISQETFDLLSTTYANHVPLNRIMPEGDEEIGAILAGGGFDVRGTGLQRARGSKLPIAPILENVLLNHQQAILRAEKNTVDLATLAFVRRFEDDLKGQITILGGAKPARTIDAAERGIRDQITALKKMLPKDDRPHHMERMPSKAINDPRVLELREDGERVLIRFRDPKLAAAFKATNGEKMPKALYPLMLYTRVMSQLATRFNPEFVLPNKIRDIQETAIYIAAQKELGAKGAGKFLLRELRGENYKAITDWLMGRDTPGARLYQEMIDEGGTTGGLALSSRDRVKESIADIEKVLTANPGNIRQALKKMGKAFDAFNKVFEDSTRLSAYRMAKARGLTNKRAAVHAKEASINFNRMGTAGPVINGLWMFSNASIQGTTKMIRAMKNPKVATTVVLGMAAAVAAVGEWNDQWDEKWREKVTKWDRLNSLVVVLPSSTPDQFNYFVIPISWGLKPILNLTNYAYDAEQGIDWEWGDFLNDMTVATLEAANPLGGTSLTQALVPTALDLPVDLRSNVSWSGSKIKPDPQRGVPEDVRYFNSLQDKASGRASIAATEALVDSTGIAVSPADVNYVFEQLVGGVGRTAGRFWTAGSAVVNGEVPDKDQFPFLARFYRRREGEEIGAGGQGLGAETRAVRELVEGQGRERIRRKYRLEDVVEELKTLPKDQVKKRIAEEVKKDPAAFDVIKGLIEAEAKGLTGLDKQINLLGVENGERARYYFDRLREASPEDRRSIVEDGVKKGLISRGVIEQIGMLNQLERLSPEQRKKARSLASENGLQLPPE